MKKCGRCKIEKNILEFYKNKIKKDGLNNNCKMCSSKINQQWKKDNKDKINLKAKKNYRKNLIENREKARIKGLKYRKNHSEIVNNLAKKYRKLYPDKYKNSDLKKNYGINLDKYNEMFKQQKECCKICEIHQSLLKKSLCVDHCHATGKIRGLLCNKCNHGIGFFNDNLNFLKNAIKYLEENKNV